MDVFVRKEGVFGGVCGGVAHRTGVPVAVLRVLAIISMFLSMGLTLLIYFAAVLSFPNEITRVMGDRPMFLGVCHYYSQKLGIHESWLRFATLIACIFTAFAPVFAIYMILFLAASVTQKNYQTRYDYEQKNDENVRDVN